MVAAAAKKTENSITVFRRQVIQTGSYEPAEASCAVTLSIDADTSEEEVADLLTRWGAVLELSNYEALGVGYEMAEAASKSGVEGEFRVTKPTDKGAHISSNTQSPQVQ